MNLKEISRYLGLEVEIGIPALEERPVWLKGKFTRDIWDALVLLCAALTCILGALALTSIMICKAAWKLFVPITLVTSLVWGIYLLGQGAF